GRLEYAVDAVPVFLVVQKTNTAYGVGVNPFAFKWALDTHGSVVPYLELGGGMLYTSTKVPEGTSHINFTTSAALGLHFLRAMRTGGKAPSLGTPAPDFTLNSQDGKSLSLHDLRGKWVVLYFYPKDFTSGCTKEAHNFQRDREQYERSNAIIIGVSVQDEATH